jgi:hypothetical protein
MARIIEIPKKYQLILQSDGKAVKLGEGGIRVLARYAADGLRSQQGIKDWDMDWLESQLCEHHTAILNGQVFSITEVRS